MLGPQPGPRPTDGKRHWLTSSEEEQQRARGKGRGGETETSGRKKLAVLVVVDARQRWATRVEA